MSGAVTESHVEEAALAWLEELGYAYAHGMTISPEGPRPERAGFGEVLLLDRLRGALARLNPALPGDALAEALAKVTRAESPGLVEENRRLHRYLIEGVPVEYRRPDGSISGEQAKLIDFDAVEANDWLVVNQLTVVENRTNRRPDMVVYVNGLPLGVIELKNPGDENATLDGAQNQLETYKSQITSLFRTNAVMVISDGVAARIGSLTANRERYMPWRTVTGEELAHRGTPELETLLKGVFERRRFLDLLKDFMVFGDTGGGLAKILAGYHQFHAVRRAVESTLRAAAAPDAGSAGRGMREDPARFDLPGVKSYEKGDRRIGVIWHTQGSGKSLLMAFYAGQVIKHPAMENPTVVVLTDRNDLDDQLFSTFSLCKDLLRQTPQQAEDRDDLRRLLNRSSGGVIFTTLQKFSPDPGTTDYPVLTDRRNVIVIADEAHRSQYGFKLTVKRTKDEVVYSYGFAKYMREALPNASFIGFTGTPIETSDVNTPQVFGDYIDVYDISRAVEDGATVPIYYESRLARIELDEDEKPTIDAEIAELTEDEAESEQDRLKRKWASVEALVGSEKRLELVAADLVAHYEARTASLEGKAMIVCMSRRICVALYDAITALRPEWASEDDDSGAIKVVMTGAASDPPAWQQHIGRRPKARREGLAKRAKNPKDPLKLVIVRDMWLTGFDAPCMHTMYIDKPMKGHGLMQAIARVNRVFSNKPGGLVVDYIGVAQNLKSALSQYSKDDQGQTGIDEAEAVRVLMTQYEVVRAMFYPDQPGGFDYRPALSADATPQARLGIMAGAMDWVLTMQQKAAALETTDEGKKKANRRYADAVVALSKAFALTGAADEARAIRDEVGFFQAVRAALMKTEPGDGRRSTAERELAIQQLVSRAVVSTEIIDIMRAAGIQTPDISILSDAFLEEVRGMDKKNLAIEALRKLINGDVRAQSRTNVTRSRAFSEQLEAAIARYHANAITTTQMLEELIQIAKDIQAARARGEEMGLSPEEVAFYEALATNGSAREAMGEPGLRLIAHELVKVIKDNISIDWMHRESTRADIRRRVRRLLRRYGYPPDLEDAAVQRVLEEARALSEALA